MQSDPSITHVAVVHCETTTGMPNPLEAVGRLVKDRGKCLIVDAMSSFGGIPMEWDAIGMDRIVGVADPFFAGLVQVVAAAEVTLIPRLAASPRSAGVHGPPANRRAPSFPGPCGSRPRSSRRDS